MSTSSRYSSPSTFSKCVLASALRIAASRSPEANSCAAVARDFVFRANLRACPLGELVGLLLWRRGTEQSEWMAGQECPKETGCCEGSESRGRIDVVAKPLRSSQPVDPVGSKVDYLCRCFCHLTSTPSRGPLAFSDQGRTGHNSVSPFLGRPPPSKPFLISLPSRLKAVDAFLGAKGRSAAVMPDQPKLSAALAQHAQR